MTIDIIAAAQARKQALTIEARYYDTEARTAQDRALECRLNIVGLDEFIRMARELEAEAGQDEVLPNPLSASHEITEPQPQAAQSQADARRQSNSAPFTTPAEHVGDESSASNPEAKTTVGNGATEPAMEGPADCMSGEVSRLAAGRTAAPDRDAGHTPTCLLNPGDAVTVGTNSPEGATEAPDGVPEAQVGKPEAASGVPAAPTLMERFKACIGAYPEWTPDEVASHLKANPGTVRTYAYTVGHKWPRTATRPPQEPQEPAPAPEVPPEPEQPPAPAAEPASEPLKPYPMPERGLPPVPDRDIPKVAKVKGQKFYLRQSRDAGKWLHQSGTGLVDGKQYAWQGTESQLLAVRQRYEPARDMTEIPVVA